MALIQSDGFINKFGYPGGTVGYECHHCVTVVPAGQAKKYIRKGPANPIPICICQACLDELASIIERAEPVE